MNDIILEVCMQYENYSIKTVGEEAFYSYYILYHYFKISKIRQKIKKSPIVRKSTNQVTDIILETCIQNQIYSIKTDAEEAFYIYYVTHYYLKISNIRQNIQK